MLTKYYFMQRGDVRKNEQPSRLNLHVRVCEEEHQHACKSSPFTRFFFRTSPQMKLENGVFFVFHAMKYLPR